MLTYTVKQPLAEPNRPKFPDETSSPLQTQSSLMMWFKAFSCHVTVIPFHRSPRKRYMQYFYQQFRLCHRDNHGEFLWRFGWFLQCVNVLSIPQPAGPPVNVTCNIFINSFGSIAETTMVSGVLTPAQELRLNHTPFSFLPNLPFFEKHLPFLYICVHKNTLFLPSKSLLAGPRGAQTMCICSLAVQISIVFCTYKHVSSELIIQTINPKQ